MYDLIGDIHGHADQLKKLLFKMGYSDIGGFWQHPERKVIFVGDFIDRGPSIREVLHIVRKMIDNDQALAVMGNHEYNAIAYAYLTKDGSYLRSHNATHNRQHQATLEQFSQYTEEWDEWVQWFYTLPLFLEVDGIRVVHACWDEEHVKWLKTHHGANLTESMLVDAHDKKSHAHVVVEETLKGKEMNIPEHCVWHDKDGHPRASNRIKWWVDPSRNDHDKFLFNCPDILKEQAIPANMKFNIYPADAPPVFFGHYWLEDKWPIVQSKNVICLDYSVAKGGNLVAYRWSGEICVCKDNFEVADPTPNL